MVVAVAGRDPTNPFTRPMPNRREFLSLAGRTGGGIVLAACGRSAGAALASSRAVAEQGAFRGARAGDRRIVEGIALRWCPPGRFTMGSPPEEPGHRPDQVQAEVTLTKGFWAAAFHATQGEWRRVVGAYPDKPPTAAFGAGDDFPMYWVNFDEASDFCARLTALARRTGALPNGWTFTLPTEAQWEYACRAGTVRATSFGDGLTLAQANFNGELLDGSRTTPAVGRATKVGSYQANAWGMHDMHGNVWQWCQDWYHARLPGGVDPDLRGVVGQRNRDGTYSRVRRGGAWIESARFCRSASRLPYEPPRRSDHIGFRVFVVEV
jgi:sulfatase modifying factor 1